MNLVPYQKHLTNKDLDFLVRELNNPDIHRGNIIFVRKNRILNLLLLMGVDWDFDSRVENLRKRIRRKRIINILTHKKRGENL